MSAVDDIVSQLPMAQLAGQVGSDEQTTEAAVRHILPTLLGGLQANAGDPAGAASLAAALESHSPALVEGGVDLADVDAHDGDKIVGNIFGSNADQVAHTLGGSLGGQTGLVQRLLPILAPIVLSYLTKRLGGQSQAGGAAGGLADVLGQILGGASSTSGGLGGVLGGLLGEGSGSGGLSGLLGGLLGGGKR